LTDDAVPAAAAQVNSAATAVTSVLLLQSNRKMSVMLCRGAATSFRVGVGSEPRGAVALAKFFELNFGNCSLAG